MVLGFRVGLVGIAGLMGSGERCFSNSGWVRKSSFRAYRLRFRGRASIGFGFCVSGVEFRV